MLTLYDLRYYDCNGRRIGSLDAVLELEYGRQKNDIGAATVILPGELYPEDIFNPDSILEIWRYDDITNSFKLMGDTFWLLRKIEHSYENNTETISLVFFDTISLIKRRVNAWFAVDPAKAFIDDYPSTFLQPLDDMAKMVIFHNFGEGAIDPTLNTQAPVTTGPSIPGSVIPIIRPMALGIDLYKSLGQVTRLDFAWENCLDILQNIADVSESFNEALWFDIEYYPSSETQVGSLLFKTWIGIRGNDLSNDVTFGPNYGNLDNVRLTQDYQDEATFAFGIGDEDPKVDDGEELILNVSVYNANASTCPYYPIETVVDADSDVSSTNLEFLESQTRAALILLSPVATLTGDIIDQGDFRFGVHYNYGDLVSVTWKNILFKAEINKFSISVDNSGEKITIPIESSKNFDATVTS